MLLTIHNLTEEPIVVSIYPVQSKFSINRGSINLESSLTDSDIVLLPSLAVTTSLPKGSKREIVLQHAFATLHAPSSNASLDADAVETEKLLVNESVQSKDYKLKLSVAFFATWQALNVPSACPWRVYTVQISRKHHRLIVLNYRNLGSFLADLPDRLPLSSVALPGTHDTMAFHGWPISQCQSPSTQLSTQLLGGVRVIDIRLAVVPPPSPTNPQPTPKQELIAYHGLWPQQTPFSAILNDVYTFLTSPIGSKETIVMSIKQEDFAITPAPLFSQIVHKTIMCGPGGWVQSNGTTNPCVNKGMWFLENRIPSLGEVRGKVIMLSRFGGNGAGWEGGLEGLGIHPTTWPDSVKQGFEWELKGTRIRTHDWYGIPTFLSIPEKIRLATANLLLPMETPQPVLPITYFSAANFPLALPPHVAKGFGWPAWGLGVEGVNSRLGAWLLEKLSASSPDETANVSTNVTEEKTAQVQSVEPRIRGWTFLDYYAEPNGADLVPLLVECNFRGRRSGQEGW